MRETASFAADDALIRLMGQVFDHSAANEASLSRYDEPV